MGNVMAMHISLLNSQIRSLCHGDHVAGDVILHSISYSRGFRTVQNPREQDIRMSAVALLLGWVLEGYLAADKQPWEALDGLTISTLEINLGFLVDLVSNYLFTFIII